MTRTGATMNATAVASAAAPSALGQPQHSPWHSPVPYLFGGLAAMLGLIAFALLILACSYWKLSGYLEGDDGASSGSDAEAGHGAGGDAVKPPMAFEEKILVIMAGDVKPTYLATPMSSSRASSFGERSSSDNSETTEKSTETVEGTPKQGNDQDQVQTGNPESREP